MWTLKKKKSPTFHYLKFLEPCNAQSERELEIKKKDGKEGCWQNPAKQRWYERTARPKAELGAGEQNETWTSQAAQLSPRRKRHLNSKRCAGVFPGGPVVRNLACQCRRHGIEPRSGRTPRAEGQWALEHHVPQRQVPAGQAGFHMVQLRPGTARWVFFLKTNQAICWRIFVHLAPCSQLSLLKIS